MALAVHWNSANSNMKRMGVDVRATVSMWQVITREKECIDRGIPVVLKFQRMGKAVGASSRRRQSHSSPTRCCF